MGSLQDAVMQYVEGELKKDPRVKNATLFAAACEIDTSVGELTLQQFHAKYRLPAIRSIAPQGRPARKPKAIPTPDPSPASLGDGAAVMEYVERTLEANPGIANADLFAGAREIDPSVGQLTGRQFHARFPLQVKARLARAAAPEAKTPPEPEVPTAEETAAADAPPVETGDPVAVRRLLLDLAKELASAESKAEVIEVMARLDEYVAEIMEAARG
ncbi:MAG: hypothetical protein OXH49_09195 [Gemmatimonadetes bacterium]|nr:hypothetical protein [Gemmatimonadota bacterium]